MISNYLLLKNWVSQEAQKRFLKTKWRRQDEWMMTRRGKIIAPRKIKSNPRSQKIPLISLTTTALKTKKTWIQKEISTLWPILAHPQWRGCSFTLYRNFTRILFLSGLTDYLFLKISNSCVTPPLTPTVVIY